jgi:predicted nuclease with TOPRIM domain
MSDDFEKSAFGMDERFEKLESTYKELMDKVEKLESDFEGLPDEVEQLKISGFQEQINNINNGIVEIKNSILETDHEVALIKIEDYRYKLLMAAERLLGNNRSKLIEFREYIERTSASAKAEIKLSKSPLVVSHEFDNKIREYCKRHNINAFIEE